MSDFERRVQRARQEKEAREHQGKVDEKRRVDEVQETERQRVEAIEKSPEWKKIVAISKNPDFLRALEMCWEKATNEGRVLEEIITLSPISIFSILGLSKRKENVERVWKKKTFFKKKLMIDESPEDSYIKLSFSLGDYTKDDGDGGLFTTCDFFVIKLRCNVDSPIELEFREGYAKERFKTLDELLDHMAEQLA